jgi:hypothetical protein
MVFLQPHVIPLSTPTGKSRRAHRRRIKAIKRRCGANLCEARAMPAAERRGGRHGRRFCRTRAAWKSRCGSHSASGGTSRRGQHYCRLPKAAWSRGASVGTHGIGPWQHMELDAFLREFVSRGCPVIPVILPSVHKPPNLPVFLKGMHWVDFPNSSLKSLRRAG